MFPADYLPQMSSFWTFTFLTLRRKTKVSSGKRLPGCLHTHALWIILAYVSSTKKAIWLKNTPGMLTPSNFRHLNNNKLHVVQHPHSFFQTVFHPIKNSWIRMELECKNASKRSRSNVNPAKVLHLLLYYHNCVYVSSFSIRSHFFESFDMFSV